MVISIILGLVISAILVPPFLDLTDKIQDHLLEKKLRRQMLKRIKGGSK